MTLAGVALHCLAGLVPFVGSFSPVDPHLTDPYKVCAHSFPLLYDLTCIGSHGPREGIYQWLEFHSRSTESFQLSLCQLFLLLLFLSKLFFPPNYSSFSVLLFIFLLFLVFHWKSWDHFRKEFVIYRELNIVWNSDLEESTLLFDWWGGRSPRYTRLSLWEQPIHLHTCRNPPPKPGIRKRKP